MLGSSQVRALVPVPHTSPSLHSFSSGYSHSTRSVSSARRNNGKTFWHTDSNGGMYIRWLLDSAQCDCIACGATTHSFNTGSCGAASGACSATQSGSGCYTTAPFTGCDCATRVGSPALTVNTNIGGASLSTTSNEDGIVYVKGTNENTLRWYHRMIEMRINTNYSCESA